jgi:hypothetical protein
MNQIRLTTIVRTVLSLSSDSQSSALTGLGMPAVIYNPPFCTEKKPKESWMKRESANL